MRGKIVRLEPEGMWVRRWPGPLPLEDERDAEIIVPHGLASVSTGCVILSVVERNLLLFQRFVPAMPDLPQGFLQGRKGLVC